VPASQPTASQPSTAAPAGHATQPDQIPRVLNLAQASSVVVGTVVGSAIFLVPSEMTQAVGSAPLVALALIVGGLLSLAGAATYAELGARRPSTGGEYVYLRDAYGDRLAFLYMWTWFAVAKPASIASVTSGLARTLAQLPALHFLGSPVLHTPVLYSQLLAIAATWLVTGINCLGIRKAGDFQLSLTLLKLALILAVVAVCFSAGSHFGAGPANFSTRFPHATGGIAGFMVALVAALWAYDGWNDLTMVAGEVRNPARNLPIALIGSILGVAALYLLTTAAIQWVLPASTIAASPRPGITAVAQVSSHWTFTHAAAHATAASTAANTAAHALANSATSALATPTWPITLLTLGMAVGILVGLNGTVMSGARVPYAASRDGLFFHALARVSPRFQSPANALLVQASLSTLLLLAIGRFQQLFELAIFSEWLFYCITATTVFVFRRREAATRQSALQSALQPASPHPFEPYAEQAATYQVPGYPVVPALFCLASAALLWYSYQANLRDSLIGTALILLGLPLYEFFRRRST
jgi:APA family basic amino acid/polyamine antiporter